MDREDHSMSSDPTLPTSPEETVLAAFWGTVGACEDLGPRVCSRLQQLLSTEGGLTAEAILKSFEGEEEQNGR